MLVFVLGFLFDCKNMHSFNKCVDIVISFLFDGVKVFQYTISMFPSITSKRTGNDANAGSGDDFKTHMQRENMAI